MELTATIHTALANAGFPVVTVRYIGGSYMPEFSASISSAEGLQVQSIIAACLNADRCAGIDAAVQVRKNASLGKTPEEVADTLRLQVNLGFGGLLLLITQLRNAVGGMLISSNICSLEQWQAMLTASLTTEQLAEVSKRLTYWQWVIAIDAEAAACKADPNRVPNFPPAPTLN